MTDVDGRSVSSSVTKNLWVRSSPVCAMYYTLPCSVHVRHSIGGFFGRAIMQSVARTAFMSNGLVIIASISRLRAIYECAGGFLQHYNRSDQASQSLKTVSTGDKAGHSNPTSSSQSLLIDPINSKDVLPTPRPNDPPQTTCES